MVTQNTISHLTQPSRFVCLNSTEPDWECSFERSEMWFRNVDVNCVFVSETWVFNILVLCRKVEGKYAGCCSFQSLTVCLWQRAFQRNFEGCCVCLVSNPNLPPPPTLVVFSCSAYKRRDMKPLVFLRKTTELHEGRLNIWTLTGWRTSLRDFPLRLMETLKGRSSLHEHIVVLVFLITVSQGK